MKVTLSETQKNLPGINSGVDEAKNQIKNLEHEAEQYSIRTSRRKKNLKKRGQAKEPLGHLQMHQQSNDGGAGRRGEKAGN